MLDGAPSKKNETGTCKISARRCRRLAPIIAKVRTAYVPVEIFCFEIEGKRIGKQGIKWANFRFALKPGGPLRR